MNAGEPRWPEQDPGPEAMWRGQKGDKGEQGPPGPVMTRGARRSFLIRDVILTGLTIAAIFFGAHAISRVTALAQSQCQSNHHLGAIPIPVKVPAGQAAPSKFGVRFVADARQAWRQADCPGRLGPPSPGLVHWARVYKIPVA